MGVRLTPQDAMFLFIESARVHMETAGLSIYDPTTRPGGAIGLAEIRHRVACRIHRVPRFRQRVVAVPFEAARPVWTDDPGFDLNYHVREEALPAPGSRRQLEELAQRIQSVSLDRDRPLWELHLIQGLEGGRFAVLTRTHHALVDGIGGVDLASVLLDLTPRPARERPRPWKPEPLPASGRLLLDALWEQARSPVGGALHLAGLVLRHPRRLAGSAALTLQGAATWIGARPLSPPGPFTARVGLSRRFAMCDIPVAEARAVKQALGGSLNDVILAVVAGGLRRLLQGRGLDTNGLELRTMVPVSVRGAADGQAPGNHVSAFFVDLPVGETDPRSCLKVISERTAHLKASHEDLAAQALVSASGLVLPTLQAQAAHLVASQNFAHLVVSNIPGPDVPLYFCGARHLVTYPVMPLAENIALSIAVVSLGGVMGFGFTGDREAMRDVRKLAEHVEAAFAALQQAARQPSASPRRAAG